MMETKSPMTSDSYIPLSVRERAREALNALPEHVLRQAAEGKPHAEEQIVFAVINVVVPWVRER